MALALLTACGQELREARDACYDAESGLVRVDFGSYDYGQEQRDARCDAVLAGDTLTVTGSARVVGRRSGEDLSFELYAECAIEGGAPGPDTLVTVGDETVRFADFACTGFEGE